jgi:hypothetical protein
MGRDIWLRITGHASRKTGWAQEEVRARETTKAVSANNEAATRTHTGVSTDDGFTAELTVAEVRGCADCIVSCH